jgi:hypothetical protein
VTDEQAIAALIDRHPGLTAAVARFVLVLEQARGRIVSYGALSQRIEQMTAEYPTKDILRTSAKRARQAGFEVEVVYDVGYRMPLPGGEDVFRFKGGVTVDDQR